MSINTSNGILNHYKPLDAQRTRALARSASKFQQGFSPLMASEPSLGETGNAMKQLTENPSLSRLMVANGGYGLQAFVQSLGLMDVDGSLQDACSKLLAMSQTRIQSVQGESPGRTLDLARTPQTLGEYRRNSGTGSETQASREVPSERQFREESLFEADLPATLCLNSSTTAHAVPQAKEEDLSRLSAKFESGAMGAEAIGYDRVGGTSYGLYQIASKPGTMDRFLDYLDENAPDLGSRLRSAGPANTGSKEGAMPDVWRTIAGESPKRFADLQKSFIRQTHFEPAAQKVYERTGLNVTAMSQTMQEVLWSTAVQHGATGGADIFANAVEQSGSPGGQDYESRIIENVYAERSGRFGSSTQRVQNAVRSRFQTEKQLALLMLQSEQA